MKAHTHQDLFSLTSPPIEVIKGIKFTPREIDVLACVLAGRTAKTIASFLSVSAKTVENHIYHIMLKLECNSRESIKDFLESSNEIVFLKIHYADLAFHQVFVKKLKELASQNLKASPSCSFIYWAEAENYAPLFMHLEKLLKIAGAKATLEVRNNPCTLQMLLEETENHSTDLRFLGIPLHCTTDLRNSKDFSALNLVETTDNLQDQFSLLCLNKQKQSLINCSDFFSNQRDAQKNYYLFLIEILRKLFPHHNFEDLLSKLKQQYASYSTMNFQETSDKSTADKTTNRPHYIINSILSTKKWFVFAISISAVLLLLSWRVEWLLFNKFAEQERDRSIRSDLFVPAASTLLDRPKLLTTINGMLRGSEGIQTVSLVGCGGAGKTTLARHYARQQKSPLIWEINAETRETLMSSLKALAYAASQTQEEKRELREIQDIKELSEREGQLLIFLKNRLRAYPNWLLIYDNVESLPDIQSFFPTDASMWGNGSVLITTQNLNVKNNSYIENMKIIKVGELSEQEKLYLFNKIIQSGGDPVALLYQDSVQKINFLKGLPPFPLDVATAAYYLKDIQIPYDQYLESLNTQYAYFDDNQYNILKDVGKYNKTRYAIISLSLKQIIDAHPDFKDVLLLISLVDSQAIPKDLLCSYRSKSLIEKFLHELKKRSFIFEEGNRQDVSTFSIHRSVQKIFLSCLVKKYTLTANSASIHKVIDLVDRYVAEKTDQEDIVNITLLMSHLEKFLQHKELLSDFLADSLKGELGFVHYYLGHHHKSINLLISSIQILQKSQKNFYKTGRLLACLASAYIALGDIKSGVKYHEQSTAIFQKYFPNRYLEVALHLTFLGNAYRDLGQYEKAKNTLEHANTVFRENSLQDQVGYARNLIDLGKVYRCLGEYQRAKDTLENGFANYKKCLSDRHFRSAWAAVHVAHTYNELQMHMQAKELLEYALNIYQTNFSKNHIEIAWVLTHIGYTYKGLHQYEKAKRYFNDALAIYKKGVADDHIEVAWASIGLVSLNPKPNQNEMVLLQRCLTTYEKYYGDAHVETAQALINLGDAYYLQGDLTNAILFFEKASQIFESNKHPNNYMALEALAKVYLKKYEVEKRKNESQYAQILKFQALNALKQSLAIVLSHFPADSPHKVRIQNKIEESEEI